VKKLPVGVRLQAGRLQLRFDGRKRRPLVEQLALHFHDFVAPDTVILELSNPELEQSALEARATPDDDAFDGAVGGGRDPGARPSP